MKTFSLIFAIFFIKFVSAQDSSIYLTSIRHIIQISKPMDTMYISDDFDICKSLPNKCGSVVLIKVGLVTDILKKRESVLLYKIFPIVNTDKNTGFVPIVPFSCAWKEKKVSYQNGGGFKIYFDINNEGRFVYNRIEEHGI